MLTVGIVIFVVVILYLYAIRPSVDKRNAFNELKVHYYAHRGLHDDNKEVPENSLKAFELAVQSGHGMELDVQLSADGEVVVFHDEDTKRLCGVDKKVSQLTYAELCEMRLADTDEKIPLFSELLKTVDGKTPLIVELKPYNDVDKLCRAVNKLLDGYDGLYCIESFNPFVVEWYRKNHPNVIRGQLSCKFKAGLKFFLVEMLLTNIVTRPDFIAYNHRDRNNLSLTLCRKLFGANTVAWTIRSQDELNSAKNHFDLFIFESFSLNR